MADGLGKVPIIACVREAWQFALQHWRAFLPAAAITAVIAEIAPTIMLFGGSPDGAQQSAAPRLSDIVSVLPTLLAGLMFSAAVLRKAVRNEFTGATGLMLGADEARLVGVLAAMLCAILPLGMLARFIVVSVVLSRLAVTPEELQRLAADPEAFSAGLQNALGQAGSAALLLFMFAVMGLALYAIARLFMINAATIGERRPVIFQTWSWSRGNVLRVLGAIMLAWIPAVFVGSLVADLGIAVLNAVATPGNAAIAIPLFRIAMNFIGAILGIPAIALAAVLYRGLRPKEFVAK